MNTSLLGRSWTKIGLGRHIRSSIAPRRGLARRIQARAARHLVQPCCGEFGSARSLDGLLLRHRHSRRSLLKRARPMQIPAQQRVAKTQPWHDASGGGFCVDANGWARDSGHGSSQMMRGLRRFALSTPTSRAQGLCSAGWSLVVGPVFSGQAPDARTAACLMKSMRGVPIASIAANVAMPREFPRGHAARHQSASCVILQPCRRIQALRASARDSQDHRYCLTYWVCLGGSCLYDVDSGGRPWRARRSISHDSARNRALKARIRAIFSLSGAEFGRGADFRGPDEIRWIASGPRNSAPRPISEPDRLKSGSKA